MHVEQAKEMDVLGDSNMYKSNPINVMNAFHKEQKDDNPWPITGATSKLLNTQREGTYADCTNSCNNLVVSHKGTVDSVEEDSSGSNSDEHV